MKNLELYFEKHKETVEAIKIAYGFLHIGMLPVQRTFKRVINYLYRMYNHDHKIGYLYIAVLHLQAYIEMGFDYDKYKCEFDRLLDCKKIICMQNGIISVKNQAE